MHKKLDFYLKGGTACMNRIWKTPALMLVVVLVLSRWMPPAQALDGLSQSGQVVARALGQMGYTEGADEFTVFGQRYGYPNGFWCDMFVSWCADEAQVSKEAFPRSVNCARHCRAFTALGRYQNSAARGGTYIPQQGDLVLFQDLETGRIHHVGLVLYVEDGQVFTVEGNALTTRLDYPAEEVSEARISEIEPNDYVTSNRYFLEDPRIHGYAVPAYTSRDPLPLEGFVDLGRYEYAREAIETVVSAGLMEPTSSHTFSPRAGMERVEFVKAVLSLCGPFGCREDTSAFSDVPPDSPDYWPVMCARSTGLLPETGENAFYPRRWISGEDAQAILSAAMARMGRPERSFSFTPGDLSQILTPYTTRGDIAQALCAIREDMPLETESISAPLTLWGGVLDWPARMAEGSCYVPLSSLLSEFPELEAASPAGPDSLPSRLEAPLMEQPAAGGRAVRRMLTLEAGGKSLRVRGFLWNNTLYASLEDIIQLLSAGLAGSSV